MIVPGVEAAKNVVGAVVALPPATVVTELVVALPLVVARDLEAAEVAVVVSYTENKAGVSHLASFLSFHSYLHLASIFAEGQPAAVDARLANSAEDRLILSFKSLSLRQDAMPPRPDFGTKG